jgi:hypothetical protein
MRHFGGDYPAAPAGLSLQIKRPPQRERERERESFEGERQNLIADGIRAVPLHWAPGQQFVLWLASYSAPAPRSLQRQQQSASPFPICMYLQPRT